MLQLSGLWTPLQPYAEAPIGWAADQNVVVQITSVFRSWEEQAALRARYDRCVAAGKVGEPGACRYPANRPGDSAHQYGLAWDSWVKDELMPWWVAVRRYYGWRVPEHDPVHAELPDWRRYIVTPARGN